MEIEEIKQYVLKDYEQLPKSSFSHGYGEGAELIAEGVAIWAHDGNEAYETDLQVLLVKSDGSLHWIYASGCSCYTAIDHEEIHTVTIKSFKTKWSTDSQPLLQLVLEEWKNGPPEIIAYSEYSYS